MSGSFLSVLTHLNNLNSLNDVSTGLFTLPPNVIISNLFGYASIFCWICVFIPQFYENWCQKSSASVSLTFVLLWAIGDIFNLVGSIAQHLVLTAILLAAYYLLSDVILVSQVVYYMLFPGKPKDSLPEISINEQSLLLPSSDTTMYDSSFNKVPTLEQDTSPSLFSSLLKTIALLLLAIFLSFALLFSFNYHPHDYHSDPISNSFEKKENGVIWWAALCGWISTFLFCAAKVPQIWLNYQRKSTDGLSMVMFIFCCLGNVTYILSILIFSQDPMYLTQNLPWLAGAALPFIFDFTIFGQYFIYHDHHQSTGDSLVA